jgi:hypothetical protein
MQNFKRLATNQEYLGFSLFRGQSFELDPEQSDLKQKVTKSYFSKIFSKVAVQIL